MIEIRDYLTLQQKTMNMYTLCKATISTTLSRIRLLSTSMHPAVYDYFKNECQFCLTTRKYSANTNITDKTENNLGNKNDISPEDADIAASLRTVLGDRQDVTCSSDIVPGKGRPPEPPVDCCMSGCANCVWIQYAEELKQYYSDGTDRAAKEIETIENESLKAFIKLELSLK